MKGNKNIIINLMLLFLTVLICIIAMEILLRYTHLFGAGIACSEPDYTVGWRFTPNSKYWFKKEGNHPITGRINSYGWRDKDWSLVTPQNTYRAAVLGDSFVEAFQVESNKTFLALTEQRLNERKDFKVELMNFGQSGFTQTEELLILKKEVEQFYPDMVIVFFYPLNDINDINKETALDSIRPFFYISPKGKLVLDTSYIKMPEFKIKCMINWFKQHSALISLLCERYNSYKLKIRRNARLNRIQEDKGKEGLSTQTINGYLSLCTNSPDLKYLNSYSLNKALIKTMAEYCQERQIKFMIVTIDMEAYDPATEKKYIGIDPSFNQNFFEDDMRKYATLINAEYLGLQREFKEMYRKTGVYLHFGQNKELFGHWNYEGHEVVATVLAKKLRQIMYLNEK